MISTFKIGSWEIASTLLYQKSGLGVDEFAYAIGWFQNATDSLSATDFDNVIAGRGWTMIQDNMVMSYQKCFIVTPWNNLTEAGARAAAYTAMQNIISDFVGLGY